MTNDSNRLSKLKSAKSCMPMLNKKAEINIIKAIVGWKYI